MAVLNRTNHLIRTTGQQSRSGRVLSILAHSPDPDNRTNENNRSPPFDPDSRLDPVIRASTKSGFKDQTWQLNRSSRVDPVNRSAFQSGHGVHDQQNGIQFWPQTPAHVIKTPESWALKCMEIYEHIRECIEVCENIREHMETN